jgi:hypothetical protein
MVVTYKEKFNKKYKFDKHTTHTLTAVSKITGYKIAGLKIIYSKGQGAYYSNPASVRPHIKSSHEWAMARIYSAVMGGKASAMRIDGSHLIKKV